jgi:hypothetical protein
LNAYLRNRWVRAGLVLVVVGWGPLLAIGALATAGLLSDPNPNPVGPGILFFFTFWPAMICLGVGIVQARRQRAAGGASPDPSIEASSWLEELFTLPFSRLLIGLVGIGLGVYGLHHLAAPPGSRGGAGALILATVALYWAFTARMPSWFGRR